MSLWGRIIMWLSAVPVQGGQAASSQWTSCWTWQRMKEWWTFSTASESWGHSGSTWFRRRWVWLVRQQWWCHSPAPGRDEAAGGHAWWHQHVYLTNQRCVGLCDTKQPNQNPNESSSRLMLSLNIRGQSGSTASPPPSNEGAARTPRLSQCAGTTVLMKNASNKMWKLYQ